MWGSLFSVQGACRRLEDLKISRWAVCERRSHRKLVDVVTAAWATMGIGAKHVLLVALVTLLLTCAECRQGTFRQGRKDLSNSQLSKTSVLGDDWATETDSDTLEDATLTPTLVESEEEPSGEAAEFFSEEPAVEETEELLPAADDVGDVQTEENADWLADAQVDFEEAPLEGREMWEAMSPAMSPEDSAAADGPSSIIVDPDSSNFPDPLASNQTNLFLQSLNKKNQLYASMEPKIQQCIQNVNCGTPN